MRTNIQIIAAVLTIAVGCGGDKSSSSGSSSAANKSTSSAGKSGSATTASSAKGPEKTGLSGSLPAPSAPPPASAPASATASSAPPTSASAVQLPPGRTPVPTVEEWDALKKEVTVKGSSALGCETKMLREYLRVSCKGKNDTGGTPRSIVPGKGVREQYILAVEGILSLVIPYVEGIDATLTFVWTDKTHPLNLKWPKGAPMPEILGTFEGAKSPLDGTSLDPKICACAKELEDKGMIGVTCDFLSFNPYCKSTYGYDCEMLKECAWGEPSAMVSCPAGMMLGGTGHWCYQPCGADGSCPSGFSCDSGVAGEPACVEN
ncbi:MAG: hypothetical protein U0271_41055 [Polyangiaceae bacterium]